jgi:hypothetical protein
VKLSLAYESGGTEMTPLSWGKSLEKYSVCFKGGDEPSRNILDPHRALAFIFNFPRLHICPFSFVLVLMSIYMITVCH